MILQISKNDILYGQIIQISFSSKKLSIVIDI